MKSASDADSDKNGEIEFVEPNGLHYSLDTNGKLNVFDLEEQIPFINFTLQVLKIP